MKTNLGASMVLISPEAEFEVYGFLQQLNAVIVGTIVKYL